MEKGRWTRERDILQTNKKKANKRKETQRERNREKRIGGEQRKTRKKRK